MAEYRVTFYYTVQVTAPDPEEAEDKAWEMFLEDNNPTEFVAGDPEEVA